jgi:hypothetical protein
VVNTGYGALLQQAAAVYALLGLALLATRALIAPGRA